MYLDDLWWPEAWREGPMGDAQMTFQGGEIILCDTVMMDGWHHAFVKTNRNLQTKERSLMYANFKNPLGGQGIPGKDTNCDKRISLCYKYIEQTPWGEW